MNRKQRRTATKLQFSASGVTLRIAKLFNLALQHHRAGRIAQASEGYREVLAFVPNHAESLNLLGVVAHQSGRHDEAVELISKAIASKPSLPEAHHNLGAALAEQGKLDLAMACYERALALKPDYDDAYNNIGNVLKEQGKYEEAVVRYQRAIVLNNRNPTFNNNIGIALAALNRLDDAEGHYRRAIALKPDYANAHYNLGNILKRQGKSDEAEAHYRAAIRHKPDFVQAYNNLGTLLSEQGKLEAAESQYRRALAVNQSYAEAHNNLGSVLKSQGKLDEAAAYYQRAIALKTNYAEAHNNLGNALKEQGKLDEAVAQYRQGLAAKPDEPELYNNLGNALRDQGKLDDAVAQYRHALALKSDYSEALNGLGNVLTEKGNLDEAVIQFERAIALKPNFALPYGNLGNVLKEQGRLDEARAKYLRAIELAPSNPVFYRNLCDLKRFVPGDPHLASLEQMARDTGSHLLDEQIDLHFVLSKAYDDVGEHELSFRHLLQGNALKRRRVDYHEDVAFSSFNRIQQVFTRKLLDEKRGVGDPSSTPVFIVGMPRSGTTLIEQILASHPKVFGAGELMDIFNLASRLGVRGVQFPEIVNSLTTSELRQLGATYIAGIRTQAGNAERITDKMPTNFPFAGFIHLVLPNARMIHVKRDPLDTCLSCFSKLFSGNLAFTYDLSELGRYYRAYEKLMEHWRHVLPPGVMLEVQYEEVISDLEGQARRVVAHCGIEWNDACLAFHETKRLVKTASAVQVRQPIYRSSVGRWRPYQHLLQPLLQALGTDRAIVPG